MKSNNTKRKLNVQELKSVNGGKKSTAKCLLGTGGSALVGAAGGPIGYWGGGAVGMATFC